MRGIVLHYLIILNLYETKIYSFYFFNKAIKQFLRLGYLNLNPVEIILSALAFVLPKTTADISPNINLRTNAGTFGAQKGMFITFAKVLLKSKFVAGSGLTALYAPCSSWFSNAKIYISHKSSS